MHRARAATLLVVMIACLWAAGGAAAAPPRVTLKTRFVPDRLGQSTTIHYAFTVSAPTPLRTLALRLPPGMGFATTSLGIEECSPEALIEAGPSGCPADSVIGFGTAVAAVPAQTTVEENVKVTAFMGPPTVPAGAAGARGPAPAGATSGEELTVLFFLDGKWPVQREAILTSHVLNVAGRHGATLLTETPVLSVWPDGPNIGLIRFHSSIGPEGLTYHRRVGGRTVAFKPRGVSVPKRCPRGGFPIQAIFTWWGLEGRSVANTRVPCPRQRRSSGSGDPRRHRRRGARGPGRHRARRAAAR